MAEYDLSGASDSDRWALFAVSVATAWELLGADRARIAVDEAAPIPPSKALMRAGYRLRLGSRTVGWGPLKVTTGSDHLVATLSAPERAAEAVLARLNDPDRREPSGLTVQLVELHGGPLGTLTLDPFFGYVALDAEPDAGTEALVAALASTLER